MKASIALATYNGEKFIIEQLESLVNQTVLPYEIIISDDNSTDNTIKVINDFIAAQTDKNIIFKVMTNPKENSGVVGNFENAIKNTTGDFVCFCDQDDIWVENKIERVIEVFKKTGASTVIHDAQILLKKGDSYELIDKNTFSCMGYFSGFDSDGIYKFENHKYLSNIATCCIALGMSMCIKREFVFENLPISKGYNHDDWFEFCAIAHNDCVAINDILAHYRIHSSNTSGLGVFAETREVKKQNLVDRIKTIDKRAQAYLKRLYILGKDQKKYLDNLGVTNETVEFNYKFFSQQRPAAMKKCKISAIYSLVQFNKKGYYTDDFPKMYSRDIIYVLLHTRWTRRKYIGMFDLYCR